MTARPHRTASPTPRAPAAWLGTACGAYALLTEIAP
eukprot:CAMPEP_0171182770 /NCGR_PEP_ID=MMETSP0790-20130122/14939_1 /TAXON_ID=2925 /ORGANISM="Alexandrium catenella, Strain OF101" /LENGTH=35 /DNA_ID= /DNA_START= /DNA_END= /DNA_ORIENTATION=